MAIDSCAASCSAAERSARRGGRLRLTDGDRDAGIAADSDRLVERHAAEERHGQLGCQRLAAALAEDVALVRARRADEVAHVLDQPQRRHVQLLVHPHGTPRIGNRHGLRGRDHDAPETGTDLAETEGDVTGAGRHVDDQVVHARPTSLRGRTD